jgi:preprotein translocase subunit SecE
VAGVRESNFPSTERDVAKTGFLSEDNVVLKYLKETRAELYKVSWPTRREALNLTLIVVAVTFAMAVLLGVLDYAFSQLIGLIVK